MNATSDPKRIKTIKPHQRRVLRVCEIQQSPELLQSLISGLQKLPVEIGLISYFKDFPWVNGSIVHSANIPYAASSPGNLRHRPKADPEMAAIDQQSSVIKWNIVEGPGIFFWF